MGGDALCNSLAGMMHEQLRCSYASTALASASAPISGQRSATKCAASSVARAKLALPMSERARDVSGSGLQPSDPAPYRAMLPTRTTKAESRFAIFDALAENSRTMRSGDSCSVAIRSAACEYPSERAATVAPATVKRDDGIASAIRSCTTDSKCGTLSVPESGGPA
jgi:hypothetical protein